MNIAVIGTGGVGGYFGGKLTRLLHSGGNDLHISFVARNRHLEEIRKNGLILDTDEGTSVCRPTLATDDIAALPPPDLCLICVKSYDLDRVLVQLEPKAGKHTMLLPLLNGVDIYERVRNVIDGGVVFPSCVYVGTHIEKPGHIRQRGGTCTIHFGNDPADGYADPQLFRLFDEAGIRYHWSDNPSIEIWSKFIFIAAYGMVTAYSGGTISEVVASEELSGHVRAIMTEVHQIAAKKGIVLPPSIVETSSARGSTFPPETKTSFQRDFEQPDKPDERDLFGGAVLRLGERTGVATPVTRMIHDALQSKKPL